MNETNNERGNFFFISMFFFCKQKLALTFSTFSPLSFYLIWFLPWKRRAQMRHISSSPDISVTQKDGNEVRRKGNENTHEAHKIEKRRNNRGHLISLSFQILPQI